MAAVPNDVYICPQVGLAAILKVRSGCENRGGHENRIRQKRVDYLLCARASMKPLVVVELDDSSHDAPKRQDRDAFLDNAGEAAGLKILHFRGRLAFDPGTLREALHSAIEQARA